MGIYMPNIEKPKQCAGCQFEVIDTTGYPRCVVMRKMVVDGNLFNRCPLIEIPTPHGRLIDADIMQREAYQKNFDGVIGNWALFQLNYYLEEKAQTILEAEE